MYGRNIKDFTHYYYYHPSRKVQGKGEGIYQLSSLHWAGLGWADTGEILGESVECSSEYY